MPRTSSLLVLAAPLALAWSGGLSQAASADSACVHQAAPKGAIGKRVAVIVGEGAYANGIPALRNPANDATATAKAVAVLGFETYVSTNADSAALRKCLGDAEAGLANTDVAMFYYSGHGIQIDDANYLVATDARAGDLKQGFVAVQPIVEALQKKAKATLVLLDACRDNPMAESSGHAGLSVLTGRGLARVKETSDKDNVPIAGTPGAVQARGLMVAYATSPNAVAADGTGALSPFTGAFVKTVGTSGYSIQRVMGDVTNTVGKETDYAQTPWMKSSLTEELKLGGGQTLGDAQSVSDNHAAKSANLLDAKGDKQSAIVEALKGLPASPDEAALKRFAKAYLALYSAVQSRDIVLPIGPGHAQVAVSPQDRVAVYRQSSSGTSGAMEFWSVSQRKVVASPAVKQLWKFLFSPHGKYFATFGMGPVDVLDGQNGAKLFAMRGGSFVTSADFSPDESRLLLAGNGLVVIDVATHKPIATVKGSQLTGGKRRGGTLAQALFAGNEAVCFISSGDPGSGGTIGVYDLKENKARVRETKEAVSVLACDPNGRYMVRTFAVNSSEQGMEIWDTAKDEVHAVKAPIFNIMAIDPKGAYASVLAFANNAEGLYDLSTGKMGHPPTIPDGYHVAGARVHSETGELINQDSNPNPWRDWPDEALYGPALEKKAMERLTTAQRDEIAKERITFVAGVASP